MSELSTFIGGASGAKPWVSGAVIKQYAYVISPTDLQIYQRKTATGSGTTDPLYDTTNYRAVSYARQMSVSNAWSAADAPWTNAAALTDLPIMSMGVSSTAVNGGTAGTRILLVSATGRGVLEFAGIIKTSGTAAATVKTRLELIVDGRVLYDYTTIPNATAGIKWMLIAGRTNGAPSATIASSEIQFSTGFQIYFTPVAGVQSSCTFYSSFRGLEP